MGTSFNINDRYESKVEVSVTEGLVNLKNLDNSSLSRNLASGEKGILNVTKNEILKEEFTTNLSAWKEQELKFSAQPIERILQDIGIFYGVQFKLDNATVHCTYTTLVNRDESLDQTIDAISTAFSNLRITKSEDKLYYEQGTCK